MIRICLAVGMLSIAGVRCAAAPWLPSHVYRWDDLRAVAQPNGERRNVLDGPTAVLDRLHCHITTLKPGERSGPPRLHAQEEVIVVKEGRVEATADGRSEIGGPGSVIYFAAGASTMLRNAGETPATYVVVNYYPRPAPR